MMNKEKKPHHWRWISYRCILA